MYGLILNNGSWMNAIGLEQYNTGYQYDFPVIYPSTTSMVHGERKSRHYKLDFLTLNEDYPAWDLSTLTLPHVMFTLKNNHAVIIDRTNIFVSQYGGNSTYGASRLASAVDRNIKYIAALPFVIRSTVMNNRYDTRCGIYFRWSEENEDRTFYDFLRRTDEWIAGWRENPDSYRELENGALPSYRSVVSYLGRDYYTINDVTLDTGVLNSYDINDASVTTRPLYFYYDGTPKIPMLHVVMPSGTELTEGVDYTVTFRDNIEVGTGVAELTGIGDYYGTCIKGFAIYQRNTGGGGNPNIPPSGPGGGGGNGPPPSDPIPEPEPLVISSADTGFTRIYNPTLPELQDFAHYMWTDGNILQTVINHVKQYFEDPMEAFIALNILPVQVPNSATAEMVRLLFIDTGKYMKTATNQFVTVELGELTLAENYKSALDYAPNTKIDLFLPYIGTVPIDADEVMGRTVKLTYKVDICSGTCVAILKVKLDDTNFYPLYQFSGNCAIRIPFTSANMDGYINAGIGAAKIALGAVVGGALGAAAAAAAPPSNTSDAQPSAPVSDVPRTQMNFMNPARSAESVAAQEQDKRDATAAKWNNIATVARASTAAIGIRAGAKASFAHSSGFIGNSGYMSYKVPFFIMKVPRLVNPDQYGKFNGFPSLMYQNFSDLKGYTEIQQVQLTNMTATSNEKDEIQSLLKSGVIF